MRPVRRHPVRLSPNPSFFQNLRTILHKNSSRCVTDVAAFVRALVVYPMDVAYAFRDMTLAVNGLDYCPGCYEFFDFFPPPRTITAFSKTFSLKKRRLVQEHSSVCQLCLHVHRFLKDGYGPDYDMPDKLGDQYDVNIEASKCFLSGMSKNPFSSLGFSWKTSPKVRPLKLAVWASKGKQVLEERVGQKVWSNSGD